MYSIYEKIQQESPDVLTSSSGSTDFDSQRKYINRETIFRKNGNDPGNPLSKRLLTYAVLSALSLSACGDFKKAKKDEARVIYKDVAVVRDEQSINDFAAQSKATDDGSILFEADELILNANSALYTEGKDVTIRVTRLTSYGGMISSFKEKTTDQNLNGLSGGKLSIYAEVAEGKLEINLSGSDAETPAPRPEIFTGGDNVFAFLPATNGSPGYEYNDYCFLEPSNGADGGRGRKGYQGSHGGTGGDAGDIKIEIRDINSLELYPTISVGKGAPGGEGGPGLIGVKGGLPGEILFSVPPPGVLYPTPKRGHCTPAREGRQGPEGLKGEQGASGSDGLTKEICIKNPGEADFTCK